MHRGGGGQPFLSARFQLLAWTTGAALLEIMKPPQSLPLQMAERLLELS